MKHDLHHPGLRRLFDPWYRRVDWDLLTRYAIYAACAFTVGYLGAHVLTRVFH